MCDPNLTDKEAREGLLRNAVDYDHRCNRTRAELLLEYCNAGMISQHVEIQAVIEATQPTVIHEVSPYFVSHAGR